MGTPAVEYDFEALSPVREWAAYEALWDQSNASVKSIAAQCRDHSFEPFTHWVSESLVTQYMDKLKSFFKQPKAFHFCFSGFIDFPTKLLEASDPLPFLYYQGAWDLLFSRTVAVVGTRQPTEKGKRRTQRLVKALVDANFTIASGLAEGIDTVAHTTALEQGGHTIAVIGTPITEYYPKFNQALQDEIAKKHLIISQVPFLRYAKQDYRLNRFFFPERNKTMSAISEATIIVEAGETSGTLTQAREALKQGRQLFILDNCFENPALTWPAKFEKQGAIRVKEPADLLKHLSEKPHGQLDPDF